MLEGGGGYWNDFFFFNFKLPHFSLPCAGAVIVYCVNLARAGGRKINLISEIIINANGDGTGDGKRVIVKSLQICVVGTFLLFGLWAFFMCLIILL